MTDIQLKNSVGIFLIIGHSGIVFYITYSYFSGGFLFNEMTTSISLVAPMFVAYTTVIVKYIIKTKNLTSTKARKTSGPFIFIAFLFPTLFIALLITLVYLKTHNVGFATFEQFKTMLALSEILLGVYIGQVVFSLFDKK